MIKALLRGAIVTAIVLATGCKKKESAQEPTQEPAVDNTNPVIMLKGKSHDTTSLNGAYIDPGATASDDTDGDISSRITVTRVLDKDRVGGNYIYYNVKDAAGNFAQVSRFVYVRNDAYWLAGNYNVVSNCGPGFSGLTSSVVIDPSTSVNNRIIISNQQFNTIGGVAADVNGTSLSMSTQVIASSLGSGTGSISADGKSFTLTTTYTPAIQGSGGCTIVYTRQ
jgi:hypothetical protein